MINVNNLKNGITIKHQGNLMTVLEFQHVKPGKGPAFVKTKLKNIKTGAIIDVTFNAGIRLEQVLVNKVPMELLYEDGDNLVFMNTEDYSQQELSKKEYGEQAKFLKPNLKVTIEEANGEVVGLLLPDKIEYEVVETENAVKGNTTSGAMKDATLENGLVIKVPIFINQGEKIVVSTNTGKYDSRA